MRIPFPLAALVIAVALSTARTSLGQEAQQVGRVRCLVFVTENCEPCERLKTELLRLPKEWRVGSKADCDFQFMNAADQPNLAEKYKANSYPTSVVIDAEGKLVSSWVGFVESKKLTDWLTKHRRNER